MAAKRSAKKKTGPSRKTSGNKSDNMAKEGRELDREAKGIEIEEESEKEEFARENP